MIISPPLGVDELTVDDLYKRTVQEVDTLKERLGLEIILASYSRTSL